MPSLEKRGNRFRVIFRYGGERFTPSIKTSSQTEADDILNRVGRRLDLLAQGEIAIPEGTDPVDFILERPIPTSKPAEKPAQYRLGAVFDEYKEARRSLEANSLYTISIHLGHLRRILGENREINTITFNVLQEYVNARLKHVSGSTIRKEVTSLRGVWSWCMRTNKVEGIFPSKGLEYPKSDELPPYMTWEEIEEKIAAGAEEDLWDCLFLSVKQIEEFLTFAETGAQLTYAMLVMAAHTGCRRSELLRSQVQDFDFRTKMVTIREKKRVRGRNSARQIPMSPFLAKVMKTWLNGKTGSTFDVTRDRIHNCFERLVKGSKWEKIKGWHVLRHSFCSNCAAKGIDQRLIDTWLSHSTEEQRRRYRHLFPDQQRQAIESVFA